MSDFACTCGPNHDDCFVECVCACHDTVLLACPTDRRFQGDLIGCGSIFTVQGWVIADDPDGWVDCPHCGLGFDARQGART